MKELALHIMDIAQNCIGAGANLVGVSVIDRDDSGYLIIRVEDNGKGMSEEESRLVSDPFFTSRATRRVGMGVPLLRQHAEMTGGGLEVHSTRGAGTMVEAAFQKVHPDRQPLGDLEGCWVLLATANPGIEWKLTCETGSGQFTISTGEIKSVLEVDSIRGTEMTRALKRMIRNNLEQLGLDRQIVD